MGTFAPITTTTTKKPLHQAVPPLILGTATFNTQYVKDPFNENDLPALDIVSRALDLGVNAFDTSPYYGPSEQLLGAALAHPNNTNKHPRSSYFLITKAGRIAGDSFDYSPAWIRYSVFRSLERLHTSYLDLVYTHDVEFVSPAEVLGAIRELRRLRNEGFIKYVGICGYPVGKLCELADMILRETGEPLDAVQSYSHFTVQNTTLGSEHGVQRLTAAGVDCVLNASMLGMGLITTRGVDAGPLAAWHPSPHGLRDACRSLVDIAQEAGEKLEVVAIRWALDSWSRAGGSRGSARVPAGLPSRVGISVMGVSAVAELEETQRVFNSVLEGLAEPETSDPAQNFKRQWSLNRVSKIQGVVDRMWASLGSWKDHSWSSPEPGFVNTRSEAEMGTTPDDGILKRYQQVPKENYHVDVQEVAVINV